MEKINFEQSSVKQCITWLDNHPFHEIAKANAWFGGMVSLILYQVKKEDAIFFEKISTLESLGGVDRWQITGNDGTPNRSEVEKIPKS
jgi:cystathionine beta-lyase/cystathionine gamma-synthase